MLSASCYWAALVIECACTGSWTMRATPVTEALPLKVALGFHLIRRPRLPPSGFLHISLAQSEHAAAAVNTVLPVNNLFTTAASYMAACACTAMPVMQHVFNANCVNEHVQGSCKGVQ